MLPPLILRLPIGYTEVQYQGKKYGLTRQDFNAGQSVKVYAEELGGKDFISFNFYLTAKEPLLKPCEMPLEKVRHFLEELVLPASNTPQPIQYGLPKIYKKDFEQEPDRYVFRRGFPDYPLCPWGGQFAGLGYDQQSQQYVWLVKSILRDPRLKIVTWNQSAST